MQSTENAPINASFFNRFITAFLNQLLDKGLVFIIMFFALWIMYNWVQESRKEDQQEISELRGLVESCALAKKDRMESEIQLMHYKIDEVILKLSTNEY